MSALFVSVFMTCIRSCEHARDFPAAAGQVGRLPRSDSHGSCLPSTPHGHTIATSLLFSYFVVNIDGCVLQEIPGSGISLFLSF